MSKLYYQGETIRQKAEIRGVVGQLIEPDTIEITIEDPEGTLKVEDGAMSDEAVGKYFYDYLIPVDAEIGKWRTEVKAVKGYIAIEQDEFTVMVAI